MQKLLSIVIPVYNVEQYINKCLDSLLVSEQLLELLDVVIINDGTPDNSAIMAKEFEVKYPNVFRVIDQENRGHGGAWNHGTELAQGKYIFYLDSDDWFDTNEFSKLILFLQSCDTDMVVLDKMNYYAETDKYVSIERKSMTPNVVYSTDTFDWLGCGEGSNITYAHNTIYRTSMMQKYMPLFCEHVMYDDISLQLMPIVIAEDFVYVKYNVYRYYIGRPGQSFDPKVRAAKASEHVGKVLQFVMRWNKKYRNVAPKGTTRRAWADDLYSAFGFHHYYELAEYPYQIAKPRLQEWDEFINREFPDITNSKVMQMYRTLPFPLFYACFQTFHYIQRIYRFISRKIRRYNV